MSLVIRLDLLITNEEYLANLSEINSSTRPDSIKLVHPQDTVSNEKQTRI